MNRTERLKEALQYRLYGDLVVSRAKELDMLELHHGGLSFLSAERLDCPLPPCTVYLLGW